MNIDSIQQYLVFLILAITLGLFISGKYRHDIVASIALTATILVGAIPFAHAFSGFSNPAVITVATVMIITQTIMNSGILNNFVVKLAPAANNTVSHIFVLCLLPPYYLLL